MAGRPRNNAEQAVETKGATVETEKAVKKPAAKKPAAKKVDPKASVTIQYGDKDIVAKEVLAAATKAYKKAHRGVVIKTIDIYVKPAEGVAYYVVNGEGSEDFKVEL